MHLLNWIATNPDAAFALLQKLGALLVGLLVLISYVVGWLKAPDPGSRWELLKRLAEWVGYTTFRDAPFSSKLPFTRGPSWGTVLGAQLAVLSDEADEKTEVSPPPTPPEDGKPLAAHPLVPPIHGAVLILSLAAALLMACSVPTTRTVVKTAAAAVASADQVVGQALKQRSTSVLTDPAWLALPADQAEQVYRDRMKALTTAVAAILTARTTLQAVADLVDKASGNPDQSTAVVSAVVGSVELTLGLIGTLRAASVPVPDPLQQGATSVCSLLKILGKPPDACATLLLPANGGGS
jgi:hypothetical protein